MATELGIELAGLWSVEKRARGLVLEQVLDDVDERLQSPGLTDAGCHLNYLSPGPHF
jgi:hypothetical protein